MIWIARPRFDLAMDSTWSGPALAEVVVRTCSNREVVRTGLYPASKSADEHTGSDQLKYVSLLRPQGAVDRKP